MVLLATTHEEKEKMKWNSYEIWFYLFYFSKCTKKYSLYIHLLPPYPQHQTWYQSEIWVAQSQYLFVASIIQICLSWFLTATWLSPQFCDFRLKKLSRLFGANMITWRLPRVTVEPLVRLLILSYLVALRCRFPLSIHFDNWYVMCKTHSA